VSWLNSDDMLAPRAVALAVDRFTRDPDLQFVWGFCLVVGPDGEPLHVMNPFPRTDLAELRRHRNFVPQPGTFWRREVMERFGPLREDLHYMFDYDFFLRIAGNVKAMFIPEIMAHFRLHPDSKTSRRETAFLREERRVYRDHGGRWLAPFWFNYMRYRLVERPWERAKAPVRRAVGRVLGVPPGRRIRT
jgi:hypothetical protein